MHNKKIQGLLVVLMIVAAIGRMFTYAPVASAQEPEIERVEKSFVVSTSIARGMALQATEPNCVVVASVWPRQSGRVTVAFEGNSFCGGVLGWTLSAAGESLSGDLTLSDSQKHTVVDRVFDLHHNDVIELDLTYDSDFLGLMNVTFYETLQVWVDFIGVPDAEGKVCSGYYKGLTDPDVSWGHQGQSWHEVFNSNRWQTPIFEFPNEEYIYLWVDADDFNGNALGNNTWVVPNPCHKPAPTRPVCTSVNAGPDQHPVPYLWDIKSVEYTDTSDVPEIIGWEVRWWDRTDTVQNPVGQSRTIDSEGTYTLAVGMVTRSFGTIYDESCVAETRALPELQPGPDCLGVEVLDVNGDPITGTQTIPAFVQAVGSYADPEAEVTGTRFVWGDGTEATPGGIEAQADHTYRKPGTFSGQLFLETGQGDVTSPACTFNLTTTPPPPTPTPERPFNEEPISFSGEDPNACGNDPVCLADRKLKRIQSILNGSQLYHPSWGMWGLPADSWVEIEVGQSLPFYVWTDFEGYMFNEPGAQRRIVVVHWDEEVPVDEVVSTDVTEANPWLFEAAEEGAFSPEGSFNGVYLVLGQGCVANSVIDGKCSDWRTLYRQGVRVKIAEEGVVYPWIQDDSSACVQAGMFAATPLDGDKVSLEPITWVPLGTRADYNGIQTRLDSAVTPHYAFEVERDCDQPEFWGNPSRVFDLFNSRHAETHRDGYVVYTLDRKHEGVSDAELEANYADPIPGYQEAPHRADLVQTGFMAFFGLNNTDNTVADLLKARGQYAPASVPNCFSPNAWEKSWAACNLDIATLWVQGTIIGPYSVQFPDGTEFMTRPNGGAWFIVNGVFVLSNDELKARVDASRQGLDAFLKLEKELMRKHGMDWLILSDGHSNLYSEMQQAEDNASEKARMERESLRGYVNDVVLGLGYSTQDGYEIIARQASRPDFGQDVSWSQDGNIISVRVSSGTELGKAWQVVMPNGQTVKVSAGESLTMTVEVDYEAGVAVYRGNGFEFTDNRPLLGSHLGARQERQTAEAERDAKSSQIATLQANATGTGLLDISQNDTGLEGGLSPALIVLFVVVFLAIAFAWNRRRH